MSVFYVPICLLYYTYCVLFTIFDEACICLAATMTAFSTHGVGNLWNCRK